MLRKFFIRLSVNKLARRFLTQFGPTRRMARRFVAGETMDEAVAVVQDLNNRGIKAILNEVGESVTSQAEASHALQIYTQLIKRIDSEKLDSTISLKPSHVGMGFGADFCYENIADIVAVAQQYDITVEIDIEESKDVDDTLQIYHQLLDTFGDGVRLALQSYLHRTPADAEAIIERGGSIRLVKGAYQEPPEIAYQDKEAIREASQEIITQCLTPEAQEKGAYLALGSHDPVLIAWLVRETATRGIPRDRFEFQMLQGVRRDEQQRLANLGYIVRVYVPYGPAWYPYFMRRLAERPANLFFMIRALLGK